MSLTLSQLLFCILGAVYGAEVIVPTVVITEEKEAKAPIDSLSVFKVEKVKKDKLTHPNNHSLADVVKEQIGVSTQTYCANCGAKRLTINGLKAEHTSILVDGLPLHSAVSGFYGVDTIPVNGILDVEVMRGAGASLANPEAIGGTLNLVTIDPLSASKGKVSSSFGVDDRFQGKSQNHSLLYTLADQKKKWGVTLGGQFARTETWDVDNNKVSEMPQRESISALAKSRFLFGAWGDVSTRISFSSLDILGGPVDPVKPNQVSSLRPQSSDFLDGDVEKLFTGDPLKITDWVNIKRSEASLGGTFYLTPKTTIEVKGGYALQEQESIYQHGFDYSNADSMFVADGKLIYALNEKGLLSAGIFLKDQRLRSLSQSLFTPSGLNRKKDNLNAYSYAFYSQYNYLPTEKLEFDFALRLDQVEVNWLELGNKVNKLILAPRFQMLYSANDHLTHRFSYGLGYRTPLTFFESQHGVSEDGYEINVDQIEKAQSLVYSISYNTPSYYITAGAHYTYLENMAYGFSSLSNRIVSYRNTDESYHVLASDILFGYKPNDSWLLEASYENFQYEVGYKEKLPTAAIEDRIQLKSSFKKGRWAFSLNANLVGSRDLSKYGFYADHYANDTSIGAVPAPSMRLKKQKAPTFLTMDASMDYQINKVFSLSFGINNIFNYTQTRAGDSPSTWHWHFTHPEFEGLHTWGPNAGRQYFLTLSARL